MGPAVLVTAFQLIPLPVSAEEMDSLLRATVAEIPDTAIRAMNARPGLFGHAGPRVIEPLGVLSGVPPAAGTRAPYTARATWFQPIDWNRMSRLF